MALEMEALAVTTTILMELKENEEEEDIHIPRTKKHGVLPVVPTTEYLPIMMAMVAVAITVLAH